MNSIVFTLYIWEIIVLSSWPSAFFWHHVPGNEDNLAFVSMSYNFILNNLADAMTS